MSRPVLSVPLADPLDENMVQRAEIIEAVTRVIDGGRYILGPEVSSFEASLAKSLDVAHAIGVGSGTDALVLAMLALGVGTGDEVITVSHTAGPTVAAIRVLGATPVLIDVLEDTYCIDPARVSAALSERTKAIIAVHLYGNAADIAALRRVASEVPIIEDCAQAQGGTIGNRAVGSLGTIACMSFYPTKGLGAIGDGGAVATGDATLAQRVRELRTYGWKTPQFSEIEFGRCSRLDEIQASLLSVKLRNLEANISRRRQIAARYEDGLKGLPLVLPYTRPDIGHAYHLYVIRSEKRDELEAHLSARGIGCGRHYPFPVHVQPGLAAHARIPESLPVTERLSREILSLPMFATMTVQQIDLVIDAVRSFHR